MGGVGGEIVPEMLEIDALATVYERERRLAVEMEMPKIPYQSYVAPVPYAWQERVHQNNSIYFAWILRRIGVGNHQANIGPRAIDVSEVALRHLPGFTRPRFCMRSHEAVYSTSGRK